MVQMSDQQSVGRLAEETDSMQQRNAVDASGNRQSQSLRRADTSILKASQQFVWQIRFSRKMGHWLGRGK